MTEAPQFKIGETWKRTWSYKSVVGSEEGVVTEIGSRQVRLGELWLDMGDTWQKIADAPHAWEDGDIAVVVSVTYGTAQIGDLRIYEDGVWYEWKNGVRGDRKNAGGYEHDYRLVAKAVQR